MSSWVRQHQTFSFLMLAGVLALLAGWHKNRPSDQPASTAIPVIPGGPELAEFSPPDGKFSIYLPGQPQPDESSIIANRDGAANSHSYITSYRQDGFLFFLSYQDYPEDYLKLNGPKKILAAQEESLLLQKEVTFKQRKSITLNKTIPGKEYQYGAQGWGLFVQRYYLAEQRLYSLAAVGIYGVTPTYIYTIFDSFKLKD
ncbi:MAG TPA: hypothetical protein VH186_28350 [Chloroflexia bacterium]|nr:hypothetical protein [Chloroflexia bacterium]